MLLHAQLYEFETWKQHVWNMDWDLKIEYWKNHEKGFGWKQGSFTHQKPIQKKDAGIEQLEIERVVKY